MSTGAWLGACTLVCVTRIAPGESCVSLNPDQAPMVRITAGPSSSRRRSEFSASTSQGAIARGPAATALPLWLFDRDLRRDCHDQRRVGERGGRSPVLLRAGATKVSLRVDKMAATLRRLGKLHNVLLDGTQGL